MNIDQGLIIQIMLLIITLVYIIGFVASIKKNHESNIGMLALIIVLLLYQWAVYY